MREVVFHEQVLDVVDDFVAQHDPERGGVLLGPIGIPVVSEFLPDPDAITTGVSYSPSPQMGVKVRNATKDDLEVKGVLHSHPGSMDHPSAGDRPSFANWLDRMPWLPCLVAPIVTCGAHRRGLAAHKLALPNGEMSVFIVEERTGGHIQILEAAPRVLPLSKAVSDVSAALNARPEQAGTAYVSVGGHPYASTTLRNAEGGIVTLMTPYTFPTQPPVILAPTGSKKFLGRAAEPRALPLVWDINVPDGDRLSHALAQLKAPEESGSKSMPPRADVTPTVHRGEASAEVRSGIRARLDGSLARTVQEATVLVIGLGSGGSQTVEALARSSVEKFVVIDPDKVEAVNLSRSVYDAADIGSTKCAAIARHVLAINPGATVVGHAKALDDFAPDELAALVDSVDYVVAATDDPEAQYRINHVAWLRKRPAVFAGVYERGAAGEVIYTIPGATACFHCATGGRRGDRRGTSELNYGTGTLVAEPALGSDISHVVSVSVKVLLGLIELSDPGASSSPTAALVASAAATGRNFVQLAMVPEYDYFPKLFASVPGQHAYQSVWLETRSSPDCTTCGSAPTQDRAGAPPVNFAALTPVVKPDAKPVTPDTGGAAPVVKGRMEGRAE